MHIGQPSWLSQPGTEDKPVKMCRQQAHAQTSTHCLICASPFLTETPASPVHMDFAPATCNQVLCLITHHESLVAIFCSLLVAASHPCTPINFTGGQVAEAETPMPNNTNAPMPYLQTSYATGSQAIMYTKAVRNGSASHLAFAAGKAAHNHPSLSYKQIPAPAGMPCPVHWSSVPI